MLRAVKGVNLALLFLLELAALLAVGYWGIVVGPNLALKLVAAIGGPAVLVVAWALFGARKARFRARGAARFVFELVWFGAAVVALFAAGRVVLAAVLGAVCVVSKALAWAWHQ